MKYICLFKFRIQVENSTLILSKFLNFNVNYIFFKILGSEHFISNSVKLSFVAL